MTHKILINIYLLQYYAAEIPKIIIIQQLKRIQNTKYEKNYLVSFMTQALYYYYLWYFSSIILK